MPIMIILVVLFILTCSLHFICFIYTLGLLKVVLICYLLVTHWLTYFVTYLIRRARRRAISDKNKDNELYLPLFLFAHLFTRFLLCLSVHLFWIQTPIDLNILDDDNQTSLQLSSLASMPIIPSSAKWLLRPPPWPFDPTWQQTSSITWKMGQP